MAWPFVTGFQDWYIKPTQRVAPPSWRWCSPCWISSRNSGSTHSWRFKTGRPTSERTCRPKWCCFGGFIYNDDGTVVLGTADAVPNYLRLPTQSPSTRQTKRKPCNRIRYTASLPISCTNGTSSRPTLKISPAGYTSPGFWVSLSDEDALIRVLCHRMPPAPERRF